MTALPPFGADLQRSDSVTFARLLEVLNEGVWFIDADGITLFANPRMAEMLGTTTDEMLGRSPLHYFIDEDRAVLLEQMRLRQDGLSADYEARLRRVDGSQLHARVHGSPVLVDGVVVGSVAAFTDVTDLHLASERQDEALRDAEESKETTNRLVSWMSHELRTPLNTVVGFAQLLHQRLENSSEREMADHILAAGKHVAELVEDLLAFSRLQSSSLEPRLAEVDVLDVVEEAMIITAGSASEARVRFELRIAADEVERTALADQRQLTQVIVNLLSNAVKYGGCDTEVAITVEHDEHTVRCTVSDHGPGIAPHLQRAVFRPFERLENTRHISGVGLGLAIADSFMRGMNGSIALVSEPGEGAAFTVSVPRATPTAQPEQRSDETGATPSGPSSTATTGERLVLYVEDEPLNAALLGSIIELLPGRRLRVEPTVADGIAALAEETPALALLDLNLPDGSGLDVLRAIRADAASRSIPVFILSADATEEATHRALENGADRYLTKPFDLTEFLGLIDAATS